ncbi:uncharacterized protein FA14DRAFT_193106 [Meira miltonrushii]|uniref:Uncharacterized protein n=1 Tax=Meira miltonrushii TaxID=1280837 RepID=A0A316V751_9BASI|nr:uncharacterized protein FA14DRAFT_193106 [Meira miltonrushii]PWN31295.1 hypothetical protein FA14DRAFT_193106 [Meira miltonrushii]
MSRSNSVTTYIRQKPLFEQNDDDDNVQFQRKYGVSSLSKSLQLLGIKPNASRTKALLRLTGDWEGRDALLQFAQSLSLLCYSMAPIRRKQLHIASESFANARRIFILGRWLNDGAETLRESWAATSNKSKDDGPDSSSSDTSSDEQEGNLELESIRFGGTEEDVLGNAQKQIGESINSPSGNNARIQSSAAKQWQKQWRKRVGLISEYLTMLGDGCEVVALLGGSSVLWRIIGGRLAARQRHGLERIAQFIFFFAFTLGLRHIELLRQERIRKLRKANKKLLRASDRVSAEADASTLLQARPLSVTEALSSHSDDPSKDEQRVRSANAGESRLRKAEYKLLMQRKKIQLLRLERTSLRAELLFTIAEILWPHHDHTRLEGWTTFVASICHMSRLTKEARWH